jgi:hypothetical protein
MKDDTGSNSSSWPREGSLAEIDFHTPTSTAASSRIRRSPSGGFEAMPPLREPPRGLPSPGTLPPFAPLPLDQLPRRKQPADVGAAHEPARHEPRSPTPPEPRAAHQPDAGERELVTATLTLPRQSRLTPVLVGVGIVAAGAAAIWWLLN